MNTSELLHNIAKDRIDGLETVEEYQLKPIVIQVLSSNQLIELNNDIYILNTRKLPNDMASLSLVSSDNVFAATKAEYEYMDEYRYQSFCDYLEVKSNFGNKFTPYRLEFVRVIPHRSNH
jgi:hypothetical protein